MTLIAVLLISLASVLAYGVMTQDNRILYYPAAWVAVGFVFFVLANLWRTGGSSSDSASESAD